MRDRADAEVLVTGASGLVGRRLLLALESKGVGVRVVTRRPDATGFSGAVRTIGWNGIDLPEAALVGASAVVHLSGEPIFGGLPSRARRARMIRSRVASTQALAAALGRMDPLDRPGVLVCASAVGFYGSRGEEELAENSPPGSGFLADLCRDWEAAAQEVAAHGVRVVSLRIGLVLAREGGVLAGLRIPFRLGLGGPLGSGHQWMPWIHVDDLVSLIESAREQKTFSGILNAVAPEPVRNRDFTRALARCLGRPAVLRMPAFVLRTLFRDLSVELLGSRRVHPTRAEELGFRFRHPTLDSALAQELGQRSRSNTS